MKIGILLVANIILAVALIHFLASCETVKEEPQTPIEARIESSILAEDPAQTSAER